MKILVVNAGSTSYKCRLIDMATETELAGGSVERVGTSKSVVSYFRGKATRIDNKIISVPTHAEAVTLINGYLCSPDRDTGVIADMLEIDGIGFKTIQAGDKNGSVLLTKEVTDAMERYSSLAPAHNPPYLDCIYYFQKILPGVPLVGVFEPGFHTKIPEYARIFGTPYEWYERYGVKKYGYHGATFRYVTDYCIAALKKPRDAVRIIACHLGGSSSICAFANGHSVDVSMSFTPQSGLAQSARVGDIDPFVLPYIMDQKNISLSDALDELGKNGGIKGISGISADMRDIQAAADKGNTRAKLAIDKLVYDAVRYIGSYYALMQGVDVIAFSGGIGFNNPPFRTEVLKRIAFLGIAIDESANSQKTEGFKTKSSSKIQVIAVNTNEEIVVARETKKVIGAAETATR
jgi:acetate kinase